MFRICTLAVQSLHSGHGLPSRRGRASRAGFRSPASRAPHRNRELDRAALPHCGAPPPASPRRRNPLHPFWI